ncbi:hypothetical protein MINTMi27_15680 [Mycobacterium intracellulare]|nr:hypothetical protein MINTMi27_15680 [Mycobacterium intracellulare]
MILSTTIDLGPDPDCESCFRDLRYSYDPKRDVHQVSICGCRFDDIYTGTKGEMANVIAPFRGNPGIDELFSWLCR